jgi:iron(III) transport system ATP-binding protein
MPEIRVEHLSKSFSGVKVLDDVSFTVGDKELVTLLGPSGCGKTTILMSIAGFQTPDEGRIASGDAIFMDRSSKVDQPAERRNLGMVFQSYAIWPHMTVAQNVAFPLRIRKVGKREQRQRTEEVLGLLELRGYEDRYPHQLSGGQQQRVALARAISFSPDVLLLDEPFSNLDAKLRERARTWLLDLQRSLGLTTLFVTHDQTEALSMSDRVIVMNAGRILREGPPEDVYRQPGARFVADFLGQCNFLSGLVLEDLTVLNILEFPGGIKVTGSISKPGIATVAVRPEDIEVSQSKPASWGPEATVVNVSFQGERYHYRLAVGSVQLEVHSRRPLLSGPLRVRIPPGSATFVE